MNDRFLSFFERDFQKLDVKYNIDIGRGQKSQ